MKKHKIHWFLSFIYLQTFIAFLFTLGFWFLQNGMAAISCMIGAIIGIIPTSVFLPLFLHRYSDSKVNARAILGGFYLAEGLKLCVTILLFTLAFQWSKLSVIPLFIAFIAMQLAYWLLPLLTREN